jgi:hypothetical protein
MSPSIRHCKRITSELQPTYFQIYLRNKMKLFTPIIAIGLLCVEASVNATQIQGAPVTSSMPIEGQIATNPDTSHVGYRPKTIINVQDYGVTGDGTTNDTAAMSALLRTVGLSPATLIFPTGSQPLLNTLSFPPNVTLDFSIGGALKPITGQTITVLGRIIGSTRQIFYNALPGQGTIDFTGGYALEAVYPEWWGASPGASAATNTPALQAAEYAAFGTNRTNGSGLPKYNRELRLCGTYDISGELRFYHVIGFRITGCGGRFSSGLKQTAANKRILDGQSIAYGVFEQLKFETAASQNVPLVDLDNDHAHGVDLSPQNITFRDVTFAGNGLGQIGVLIAKHGGDAQGDNIRCYSCYGSGFSEAVWQIGGNNTGINAGRFYAQNAIKEEWYGGDIQASPRYGIVSYGGSIDVHNVTFENDSAGFGTQTGFDVYCEAPQETCVIENVRSESHKLAAGGSIRVINSRTIFQAVQWYSAGRSQSLAGTSWPAGFLISGTGIGGDGAYYKITTGGVFGGLGITSARSGNSTAISSSGASWTTDAFTGYRATIITGAGAGHYCVITTNTDTTIKCPAGWVTNYVQLADQPPDYTSTFVVEPNWGTQTTSGGVTWVAFPFNVIEGDAGAASNYITLERVGAPGGKIKAQGWFKDLFVSRPDWDAVNFPLDDNIVAQQYNSILLVRPDSAINVGGTAKRLGWRFARNGPADSYYNYSQLQLGTLPLVWSAGGHGGGRRALDVWIGGRSDPESSDSVSRAVLEYGGMLGRATPSGSNKNGAKTQIQGGLPTGSGKPGAIEFWMGKSGSPGTTVVDGTPVAGIKENGLSWTLFGTAVASAATITPTGNLFHVTGTTDITSISGIGVTSGTEITLIFDGVLTVSDGLSLRLANNFTTAATNTLTLKWDGSNWYEQGRSTDAGTFATVGTGNPSNTDFLGELTASRNTVSYTFSGSYISHPVCIASNETTAGKDIKVTYTGAISVTFTTPGPSDVLSYACFKRN